MREYQYDSIWPSLLTPGIVALLTQLHEFRGEQKQHVEKENDVLQKLLDIARIQSTEASNRIEGIHTSDDRLKVIVQNRATPQTRDEQEIAGYRDVLATVHENHDFIPLKPGILLQLHRDLYKYSGLSIGGIFKNVNNVIAEMDTAGNRFVRFQPVEAWETPEAINQLCKAYDDTLHDGKADPLLIIPLVVLDFLCIHPFSDGNGRMSRLLTLLLLYRAGYMVGKYISLERIIEQTKETYYEALQASSSGWHEQENDYVPFATYLLGALVAAYREMSERLHPLTDSDVSKPTRIAEIIRSKLTPITKAELQALCPDISTVTIQRTLHDLHKSGRIIKHGGGRYTTYIWNRENE